MRVRPGMGVVIVGLLVGPAVWGQRADPSRGRLSVHGSVRTRVESWDWFGDTDASRYAYSGSLFRLSLAQSFESWDWTVELAAPVLLGLPQDGVAAGARGQLGAGANYWVANDRQRTAGLVLPKQAYVRFHSVFGRPNQTLRLGRFEFADGSEVVPTDATLATLKRDRINQRLIGPFNWTHVGRSFDGLHYSGAAGRGNLTLVGALPTRGVFQTDGWGNIHTGFGYLSWTRPLQAGRLRGEFRAFGLFYRDFRSLVKTDNRSLLERQAESGDISLGTFGGHWVQAVDTPSGTIDAVGWFAGQAGRWGRLDHRAASWFLEGGWQPRLLPRVKPWLRAGWQHGSGDGSAADSSHGTFFQVLPTPRPFAKTPFYNMSNMVDRFASLSLRPAKTLTIGGEFHALRLASRQDLWYQGGGAFQPWTFGYVGRPSGGSASLANLADVSIDYAATKQASVSGYLGRMFGRGVTGAVYGGGAGNSGAFGYLELTLRF